MSQYAPFSWQREMLRYAQENGWQGWRPSVLGNHEANKAVDSAVRFLMDKGLVTLDGCGTGLARKVEQPS
jgi:hypothetical protein